MSGKAQFTLALNIKTTNEDRIAAYELYKRAFDKAYKALTEEGKDASLEGPYPWAAKLGLVTDKFGIGWALYYNE